MRCIDFATIIVTSLTMLFAPWQFVTGPKTVPGGCRSLLPESMLPDSGSLRITAVESRWGWEKGMSFTLEAPDGSYKKTVAIEADHTNTFKHLFTDVPLGKNLIYSTSKAKRSHTTIAFRLPKDGRTSFELTGTGMPYPCGLVTCINWLWTPSWETDLG